MSDIKITIIDREGEAHHVDAPTDMNMNLMEVIRSYELAPEGTIGICGGMAMCASCQCYVQSHDHLLPEKSYEEEDMLDQAFFVHRNRGGERKRSRRGPVSSRCHAGHCGTGQTT